MKQNLPKIFVYLAFLFYKSNPLVNCLSWTGSSGWDYFSNGPNIWFKMFDQCNENEQSPINIITKYTVYDSNLPRLKFLNYKKLIYWNVSWNNNSGNKNSKKIFY